MKRSKMHFFRKKLWFLTVLCTFSYCSDGKDPIIDEKIYVDITETSLTFGQQQETQSIEVKTNAKNLSCRLLPEGWCTATIANKKINITAGSNTGSVSRTTILSIEANHITKTVLITQLGTNESIDIVKDDIKIQVKSGKASSFQPDTEIEKSFDGDMSTIYHSSWKNEEANYFPITMTYSFNNVETIDYLMYHPRTSGSNGHIKEFELWVATGNKPLSKYGDYDFQGSGTASRINFSPALVNPTQIHFVVKSGTGTGKGFVACAEMEFYRKSKDNFDYLTIFTDHSCSELKSGVNEEKIRAISHSLFRNLALEILHKKYNTEFRVQSYKAWQHPSVMAQKNKTSTYGLRDNPTGIFLNQGEECVVMVGDTHKQNVSIFLQDINNKISGQSTPIFTGLNKIKAEKTGLLYIMYYTQTGNEKPIKVNIVGGTVNGYFSSQKHKKEDWSRLLKNATCKHFDLIGKHAVMTFETEAFKKYTKDGLALINKYDEMVYLQQEFMGLFKYGKAYNNRAYFLVVYTGHMYASGYHTGYNSDTQKDILDLEAFSTGSCWGPAHELGHVHQTRPGLRWQGTTEVTNNIFSMHIQTSWGNQSRLVADGFYDKAFSKLLKKGEPHNGYDGDGAPFVKLVPFWQLKLYMIDVLNKKNFYKDIFEAIRNKSNEDTSLITEGYYQLEFVKHACKAAKLDLTDFFDAWGFLTPIDISINDYKDKKFTITQKQIDQVKSDIKDMGYSKPKHKNIYDITDNNIKKFK